jgi:energy-coupling factor transporter ATP-binding protein EcfA2
MATNISIITDNSERIKTKNLIEEGNKNIIFGENKDLILILGNTGTGKSTFLQWFAGDNSKLISKEIIEGSGEFIIDDGNNKISTSTLTSKTLFPELVKNVEIGSEFYDCPGFSDTRSASHDIAITYFIKKLCDYAENVKIVFVISYSSVSKGNDRHSFMHLLRHATDLIKDIEKFSKSIALVVTKVENRFVTSKGVMSLVDDVKIIEGIGKFIEAAKPEIESRKSAADVSSKTLKFLENALKLCDIFVTKKNDQFTRIEIFRRPIESGPLSEVKLLQNGKQHNQKMISENLAFTAKVNADFGYTISAESKNYITALVEDINEKVSDFVVDISTALIKSFQTFVDNEIDVIQNFSNIDSNSIQVNQLKSQEFSKKINGCKSAIEILKDNIKKSPSILSLTLHLEKAFLTLKELSNLSPKDLKEIKKQSDFFDFLQNFSDKNLTTSFASWISTVQTVDEKINILKTSIDDNSKSVANKLQNTIKTDVETTLTEIQSYFKTNSEKTLKTIISFKKDSVFSAVDPLAAEQISNDLTAAISSIENLTSDLENEITIKASVELLKAKFEPLVSLIKIEMLDNIVNCASKVEYLNQLSNQELNIKPFEFKLWLHSLKTKLSLSLEELEKEAFNMHQTLTNKIESDIAYVNKSIEDHFDLQIKKFDFHNLPSDLNAGHNLLLKMNEKFKIIANFKEAFEIINDVASSLNINDMKIESITEIMILRENQLEFLKALSKDVVEKKLSEFFLPFLKTQQHLKDKEIWFIFLRSLYNKFSEYEFQKDKKLYNVANVADWGVAKKLNGLKISDKNFNEFLEKIKSNFITGQDLMKHITPSVEMLSELNKIIESTLKLNPQNICTKGGYVVQGDFIKFSDFVNEQDLFSCNNETNKLNIFATAKVFIDRDFVSKVNKLQLTVIAPNWEVIGPLRKIQLDGQPGPNQSLQLDSYGRHGIAGNPGGSAGSFFGIGGHFLNSDKLTISANGGKGGPGQDGQKGAEGAKGTDATTVCSGAVIGNQEWSSTYEIYGGIGGTGGNGGNGGVGGVGGRSGYIDFLPSQSVENCTKKNLEGLNGQGGLGGKGGLGGMNGDFIVVECRQDSSIDYAISPSSSSGSSGNQGVENISGNSVAEQPIVIEKALVLNEYKSFARENIAKGNHQKLVNFYNYLDDNKSIKDIYDTLSLVDELESLEKQFYKLKKETFPYYPSLFARVQDFSISKKGLISNENRKVLTFLYTAILSKISYIQSGSKSNLIIDIETYLTSAKKDVRRLNLLQSKIDVLNEHTNAVQNEKDKLEMIERLRLSYQEKTLNKNNEAKYFIKNEITPLIDDVGKVLDKEIDFLITETIELQKQAKHEKKELEKLEIKLEAALKARAMFGGLKLFGQALSFAGPYGMAAGAIVGAGSSMAESLTLKSQNGLPTPMNLPPSVKSDLRTIESQVKIIASQKANNLNKLIDNISKEMTGHANLNDVSAKINVIKNKIAKAENDLVKLNSLNTELKTELKNKEDALKTEKVDKDLKTSNAIATLSKINQGVQVAEMGFDIYNQYKDDKAKISVVQSAINQTDIKTKKLENFEENIHKIMMPMMKNMVSDMKNVASNLEQKSQAFLDVTKWKVQSTLRDMKLQMQKFTRGFQIEENIARYIEQLEETMTTLIVVYDRIQSYQEQQNLVDFVAAVFSVTPQELKIFDTRLRTTVMGLEMKIRSNLVLQQYELALAAFRQWVFPFAHDYSRDFEILKYEENNLSEDLILKVVAQIEKIENKITEYKSMITKTDEYIVTAHFDSIHVSSQPFFVWENYGNENLMAKLLSGDSVVFNANVLDSSSDKDAIKFSYIKFQLKSSDITKQAELDQMLKGFKMTATHLGNSYYRFNNQIYVITSNKQTIEYSYEQDENNEPIHKNNVYSKIKAGDLMLSPFTMWELKLTKTSEQIAFFDLDQFKSKVNLELVGNGRFVKVGPENSKLKVEQFYNQGLVGPAKPRIKIEKVDDIEKRKRSRRAVFESSFNNETTNAIVASNNWLQLKSLKIPSQNQIESKTFDSSQQKEKFDFKSSGPKSLRQNFTSVDSNLLLATYVSSKMAKLFKFNSTMNSINYNRNNEANQTLLDYEKTFKTAGKTAKTLGWK